MKESEEKQIRYWAAMIRSANQLDGVKPHPYVVPLSGKHIVSVTCKGTGFIAFSVSPVGQQVLNHFPGDECGLILADVYKSFGGGK